MNPVKSIFKILSIVLIVTFLLTGTLPQQIVSAASANQNNQRLPAPRVGKGVLAMLDTGEARVLINLRNPVSAAALDSERKTAIANAEKKLVGSLKAEDFQTIHQYVNVPVLAGILTTNGLNSLMANPDVESILLDQRGSGHLSESVTALGADIVHVDGITGQGITVAVLDTGIDTNHPDLSDDIAAQHCFTDSNCAPGNINEGTDAEDQNGHGTNVSGIITSKGTISSVGFAPDADIVAVRVLDAGNAGWVSDWLAGLDWIRTNQNTLSVDVINMSLGTWALFNGNCDAENTAMASIVSQLNALGIVIFASTGNQGSSSQIAMPACLTGVIGVGATYDSNVGRTPSSGTYQDAFGGNWPACFNETTSLQTITCFTNSNAAMDIVAPGAWITSTGRMGGGTSTYAGTSQASPTAAGIAALMLQKNASLTPISIESILKSTGTTVTDPKNGLGFPLINALAAVNASAPSIFIDVPLSYWANSYIERLYNAGITGGCITSPLSYCPDSTVTRAQMAVFLLKGMHGSSYTPPSVGVNTGFSDVALDYWAVAWIKQLAAEGITSGCGGGNYCPDATVTRAQMAIFLLKAKNGSSYTPPAVGGSTGFSDVATSYWAAPFIKQLVADGITSGCGAGIYCPDAEVTRAQMAVFLVKAFNLP